MKKPRRQRNEWIVFVGLLFLGSGIGMLFGKAGPGSAIGIGLGLLAVFYLRFKYPSSPSQD